MAKDMGGFLENQIDKVEKDMKLSAEDKARITSAGVEASSRVLHDHTSRSNGIYRRGRSAGYTNAKHRSSHRKTKHPQGMTTYKAGCTADKTRTGDTDVGSEGKYYDLLVRVANSGQHHMILKRYKNMHFFDKAQQEARKPVTQAKLKAYKGVMNYDSSKWCIPSYL